VDAVDDRAVGRAQQDGFPVGAKTKRGVDLTWGEAILFRLPSAQISR
jgi:hypothetical protein